MPLGKLTRRIISNADEDRPLYVWLDRNYDQVSAALALGATGKGRPWKALTAAAIEVGVVTKFGKPPTPQGIRSAWLTLEAKRPAQLAAREAIAEKARLRRLKATAAPLVQPVTQTPLLQPEPVQQAPSEFVERSRTKFVSRPAVLKSG
jgi:hypothetical protein